MNGPARKRRTREHIIADLSVNHVEYHALRCGFTLERFRFDYGVDLALFTYGTGGYVEEGTIWFQLKATDGVRVRPGQTTFSFRVDRRDLAHWLAETMPVVLIVYDARKHVAFWLYVQSYFRSRPEFNVFAAGKSVALRLSVENVLDADAMRRFGRFRDRILAQSSEVVHEEE